MPLEHEIRISCGSPNHPDSSRPADNVSVHASPPASTSNFQSCNSDEQMLNQSPATRARFSVLRDSLRPVILKFEDVGYSIPLHSSRSKYCTNSSEPKPTRTLVNGVTGMVKPGELLAMLGPSGSGKTTLLTALAGRLPGKISGRITYNGQPFSSSMRRKTGFVTQDDILYPHLTVVETLTYAALLRLPRKLNKQEKIEQAESVIMALGLSRCRNSIVGGALIRGISGGERKRVSIGQEMLVNPSLLLLDEPTSGLDSTTAQRIVAMLRGLARGGRSVITTVHQPSSRLYRMFDKVVVLSDGCPIFSGSAANVMEYFGSIGFVPGFDFVNPADFLLDLANGVAPDNIKENEAQQFHSRTDDHHHDVHNSIKRSLISSYKKNIYPLVKEEMSRTLPNPSGGSLPARNSDNQWTTSWWLQFKVLLTRGLRERKHESYSAIRIFQVMSVSILSGFLWWHSDISHLQDQVGLLFFFSIFWGFFPLFNAIFAFPQERPMLVRERSSSMYRLSSYYFARMAGDLPMELVLPTIFVTITYWMGGLKPSVATFTLTLLVILFNVLVSQGLGLALGAILMEVKQATALSSVIMLVFLLAGGYYIQQIPPFIAWLKYMSFSHYCYKLLVGVQYSENEVYECTNSAGIHCRVLDFPAIKFLGLGNMAWDVVALTAMFVGYRVLAYVGLRRCQLL